jgi:hypothetical protein
MMIEEQRNLKAIEKRKKKEKVRTIGFPLCKVLEK